MRLLVVLGLVVVAVLLVVAVTLLVRTLGAPRPAPPGPERWVPWHESRTGTTEVSVRRMAGNEVLESRALGRVSDNDADYDTRFLQLMEQARQRAALLDSERELGP